MENTAVVRHSKYLEKFVERPASFSYKVEKGVKVFAVRSLTVRST